jgi:hypothetical protein
MPPRLPGEGRGPWAVAASAATMAATARPTILTMKTLRCTAPKTGQSPDPAQNAGQAGALSMSHIFLLDTVGIG